MNLRAWSLAFWACAWGVGGGMCASVAVGFSDDEHNGIWVDPGGDAAIRRTDVGNDAQLPPGFEPIDLLSIVLEGWSPFVPTADPYTGVVVTGDADLVRMRIVLDGLVNPPGPLAIDGFDYLPYQFGSRPVYGFFEIDIDDDDETGGELMPQARDRYLSNVGRFGQSPEGSISDRMVRDGDDLDTNFFSDPQFERTGGEFSLVMCGCFTPIIVSQDGDMDAIFDPGETWIVSGRFFERFTSFQSKSGLFGGMQAGLFDPVVELQFAHDPIADRTTITFVYPITNAGAAMLAGEPTEPIDLSLLNQTSIEEALDDLIWGAPLATGPLNVLVEGWSDASVGDFRQPTQWHIRALLGTAPIIPDLSALFIWTDTGFDEIVGDLNNDDLSNNEDSMIIADAISDRDGTASDADGIVDGQVTIANFGFEFDLLDLNGDGVIAEDDMPIPQCQADVNNDGTLNFFDISLFLSAYAAEDPLADFNQSGTFNFFDISAFLAAFSAGCP